MKKSIMALATGGALAFAIAAAPMAVAKPESRGAGADRTLTVATYNIHHAAGIDGVLDIERIAQELENTGAEVIGLQEVDNHWGERSEFVDQAAWLAERLDMHYCYTANLDNPPAEGQTENRQYGTAILSEFPLSNCTETMLPNHPKGEQRSLAQADIKYRGVDFRFYNTHLTHNSVEGREAQVDAMNEILGDDEVPAIVVGDMNATPDSVAYENLLTHLVDVWPVVGEGDGFTIPPLNPDRRIDYIMVSDDITPESAEVISTIASDHLPVVADVTLPHPGDINAKNNR